MKKNNVRLVKFVGVNREETTPYNWINENSEMVSGESVGIKWLYVYPPTAASLSQIIDAHELLHARASETPNLLIGSIVVDDTPYLFTPGSFVTKDESMMYVCNLYKK